MFVLPQAPGQDGPFWDFSKTRINSRTFAIVQH